MLRLALLLWLGVCACTRREVPVDIEASWYRIALGGRTIGYEQRSETSIGDGSRKVLRERTYRFAIDGNESSLSGGSETVIDDKGALISYQHRSGSQTRRAWMEDGLLFTEFIGSDGSSSRETQVSPPPIMVDLVGDISVLSGTRQPVLEPFELKPVWVDFIGDESKIEWSLNHVLGRRTVSGGEFGILSWEEVNAADASVQDCCVDLVALYRIPTDVVKNPRQARRGTFRVVLPDGREQVFREERPLWAEIPPGADLRMPDSTDPVFKAYQRRFASDLKGVGTQRDAVQSLLRWVQAELEVAALPGSQGHLNALQLGAGDCSEHASLFVAAATAIGLKAEVLWGWVYWEGSFGPGFYPHAWASVTVDGYGEIPVDPVLGQFPADATHIVPDGSSQLMSSALLVPGASIAVVELYR